MYRTDFWTLWEKARVGCSERIALKQVYYQGWNRPPAQVGCMRQVLRAGALGRPRGMGWRGRREGGSGWGTHVNPWLIQVNVWQKQLQYCKVISLQLIKINENKTKQGRFCSLFCQELQTQEAKQNTEKFHAYTALIFDFPRFSCGQRSHAKCDSCCPVGMFNSWLYDGNRASEFYLNPATQPTLCISCAQLLSCVWSLMTPWTVACKAPLSMGCPRQENGSGLPFPSPGDCSDPGIELNVSCIFCIGRQVLCHWATSSLVHTRRAQ